MTVGVKLLETSDLLDPGTNAPGLRARASGCVELGGGARLSFTRVRLADIRGLHPALRDRDARLDLASGNMIDLAAWTPESLDITLCAAPPWVIQRGQAADRHFLAVAGTQLLPALRRMLPALASIPVVLVDAKFTNRRWLQVAAIHTAAIATLAAGRSSVYVQAVLGDAEAAGAQLYKDPEANSMETFAGRISD